MLVGQCLGTAVSLASNLDNHLPEARHNGCGTEVAEVWHAIARAETEQAILVVRLLLWCAIDVGGRVGELRDV